MANKTPMTMECIVDKLNKEMADKAARLTKEEARFVVDNYYAIQNYRIATASQGYAVERKVDDQPVEFINWIRGNMERMESVLQNALKIYSEAHEEGKWAMSNMGVGPVIAAGLLAHIDISKAPTVGHIWNYAGYNPEVKWIGKAGSIKIMKENGISSPESTKEIKSKDAMPALLALSKATGVPAERIEAQALEYDNENGQKGKKSLKLTPKNILRSASRRPWNAQLKTLCWKLGESFNKVQNKPDSVYGRILKARRTKEEAKNEAGDYADIAAYWADRVSKSTEAYKHYSQGQLPPGHIFARSKRYAVKMFLSHYHHVSHLVHYGKEPPKPFAIEHLGHAHYIPVPNLDKFEVIEETG